MDKAHLDHYRQIILNKRQELLEQLEKLKENGCEQVFSKPFYNEFVVKVKDSKKVNEELLKNGILGGLDLGKYYDELKNCLLFCVTEMNTKKEIEKLVSIIKKIQ